MRTLYLEFHHHFGRGNVMHNLSVLETMDTASYVHRFVHKFDGELQQLIEFGPYYDKVEEDNENTELFECHIEDDQEHFWLVFRYYEMGIEVLSVFRDKENAKQTFDAWAQLMEPYNEDDVLTTAHVNGSNRS